MGEKCRVMHLVKRLWLMVLNKVPAYAPFSSASAYCCSQLHVPALSDSLQDSQVAAAVLDERESARGNVFLVECSLVADCDSSLFVILPSAGVDPTAGWFNGVPRRFCDVFCETLASCIALAAACIIPTQVMQHVNHLYHIPVHMQRIYLSVQDTYRSCGGLLSVRPCRPSLGRSSGWLQLTLN